MQVLVSSFSGLSLGCRSGFNGQHLRNNSCSARPFSSGPLLVEAAHKKGAGSTKNGRDSQSKRRGIKVYGGQPVKAGGIIVRQVGNSFHAGKGVGTGKDYTLYALSPGIVKFETTKYKKQVVIVPEELYVKPEGQQIQEGSRKWRRRQLYTSRKKAPESELESEPVAA